MSEPVRWPRVDIIKRLKVLYYGALSFWLAYGKIVDPFEGSFFAMVAIQVALFLPTVFRVLWPLALTRQSRLLEAATTLGASELGAFFTVEWPRWRGPVASCVSLVAAASLGEVAAVSLFYSEKLLPAPLLISRWAGQYRFEEAQALSALLLVLSTALLAAGSYLRRARHAS